MDTQMMDMMSMNLPSMMADTDTKLMQDCIEACSATEQACTMCADAASGSGMDHEMARMMGMCLSTADMANTMMRMMLRPTSTDLASMMAMLEAMTMMARACADECGGMDNDYCRMCAKVCMNCVEACSALMNSMPVAS
jgi:hypothetical protein